MIQQLSKYGLLAFQQAVEIALRYCLSILLIRSLGFGELGFYNIHSGFLALTVTMSGFGYGFDIQRRLVGNIDKKKVSQDFSKQFFFQLSILSFSAPIVIVAVLYFSKSSFDFQNFLVLLGVSLLFCFSDFLFSQLSLVLRNSLRVTQFVKLSLANSLFGATFILTGYLTNNLSVVTVFLSLALANLFSASMFFKLGLRKVINLKFMLPVFGDLKSDILIGAPLLAAFLAEFMLSNGDRIAIAMVLGYEQAGQYVFISQWSSLVLLFTKFLNIILIPILASEFAKQGINGVVTILYKLASLCALVAFSISILALFLLPVLWERLLEKQVETSDFQLFYFLLASFLVQSFFILFNTALFVVSGNEMRQMYMPIVLGVLNFLSNLFLLWLFESMLLVAGLTLLGNIILSTSSFERFQSARSGLQKHSAT